MKVDIHIINTLLDEVDKEYSKRYEWGDEDSECISLFRKIRYKIEEKTTLAYKKNKNLSVEEILHLIEDFSNNWSNTPSDCDDTDGKIHINSIYDKLACSLYPKKKDNKNIYIWMIYFVIVLLCGYLVLNK